MRTALDMNQGGAIVDLRPYAAKLVRPCGVGTKCLQNASYPFLVQAYYRAGYFTHYAGEGSIKSCKLSYYGESVDLCTCRTWASYDKQDGRIVVTLDPVEIEFNGLTIAVQSIFRFKEGTGEIEITRRIVDTSDQEAQITVDEYITGCYGTTEYPEDLTGVVLKCAGPDDNQSIEYQYKCREKTVQCATRVEATIPHVDTRLSMNVQADHASGYIREGFAFSPMYTLGIKKTLKAREELRTWLKVEKAS
jgi:hypothetical protein